jgi:hypothetical protein
VEALDLVEQFAAVGRTRPGRAGGAAHPVAAEQHEVADLALLDAGMEFLTALAVAHHESDAHLELLAVDLLGQGQHLARGGASTVTGFSMNTSSPLAMAYVK